MKLERTIEELEQQAAQFTQAANVLRELQQNGTRSKAPAQGATKGKANRRATASKRGRGKRVVSDETKAKIAEKLRASHAARKKAAKGS